MRRRFLLLVSVAACSARATQPPTTASCQPKPIPACSTAVSAVDASTLSSTTPPAGKEVAVSGYLRSSGLVRCFTNRICIDGKCSSDCASPLVVSSTAEPAALPREQLETRPLVAVGDVATLSNCEGDQQALCCPFETVQGEVVVSGKVVAYADAPERWKVDVTSVCRP